MKRLCYYEGKKFFHSWFHKCLILFLLCFPVLDLTLQQFIKEHEIVMADGQKVSGIEGDRIQDEVHQKFQGTIDVVWLNQVETEVKELEEMDVSKDDIRYQAVYHAYFDGMNKYNQRIKLLEDETMSDMIKQEIKEAPLIYGPTTGWETRLEVLEHCALVYLVVCVLLCCDMFNQEDYHQMMEPLKACKYGRSTLAIAKLGVSLVVCIGMGLFMFVIFHFTSGWILELEGGSTSIMNQRSIQIHSYQTIYWQCFCLMMIGGVVSILSSVLCSTLCKQQTTSLLVGIMLILLPFLFNPTIAGLPIGKFFPSYFTYFFGLNRIMYTSWMVLYDQAFPWVPLMGSVWGIGSIILILCTYAHHGSNHKWQSYRK